MISAAMDTVEQQISTLAISSGTQALNHQIAALDTKIYL
jgi:hypothetical protein